MMKKKVLAIKKCKLFPVFDQSLNFDISYFVVDAVIIEKAEFSWNEPNVTLKNINIRIKPGSLVAIVGPVGSGKSSLLSAILGELPKSFGRVNTKV